MSKAIVLYVIVKTVTSFSGGGGEEERIDRASWLLHLQMQNQRCSTGRWEMKEVWEGRRDGWQSRRKRERQLAGLRMTTDPGLSILLPFMEVFSHA